MTDKAHTFHLLAAISFGVSAIDYVVHKLGLHITYSSSHTANIAILYLYFYIKGNKMECKWFVIMCLIKAA